MDIEERRRRVRWALLHHKSESGKQALSTSCRDCVLQLHQDSDSSLRLILQEEGGEVSGKTFLMGF